MNTFKKLILRTGIICSFGTQPALAEIYDLAQLYQSAINYDADIAAAESAFKAEKEQESSALAGLLPQLDANASKGFVDREVKQGSGTSDSYESTAYGLTLTQPLLSMPSWYTLSAAEYGSARAEADYL